MENNVSETSHLIFKIDVLTKAYKESYVINNCRVIYHKMSN